MKNVIKLSAISLAVAAAMPMTASADMMKADSVYACDSAATAIYSIQGSGKYSPLTASSYPYESAEALVVKGVVTARADKAKGFYVQEVVGDNNTATSDGIFVYLGDSAPASIEAGKLVCLEGKAKEHYGQTQISGSIDKIVVQGDAEVPAAIPFVVAEGETYAEAMERHEGMKIKLDAASDMKVTGMYGRSGNPLGLVLSHKELLMKPTQVLIPGADALALQKKNDAARLEILPSSNAADGTVPYFKNFNADDGYIRIGDTITNLEGMVGYGYSKYNLNTTNQISVGDLSPRHDRTSAPTIAKRGDIRVASFNVLNFFNDAVGGDETPSGNRGAKTEEDMIKQRTKIVNAIIAMNSDIVGLMEIANNGYGDKSAIKNLVDALNAELRDIEAYTFVEVADADKFDGKYLGSDDAIAVGMLYRATKVKPTGKAFVVATPEQHIAADTVTRGEGDNIEKNPDINRAQRHSLGQEFEVNGEKLTVIVNHFKSKGSACLEDWLETAYDYSDPQPADLQGHCNEFRVSAADAVGKAVSKLEGDVLVIGDLNSYGLEDPIRVLTDYDASKASEAEAPIVTAAYTTLNGEVFDATSRTITKGYGLVNLNTQEHGVNSYGYNYANELGNLDHALANTSAAKRVVGIEDWHINAVETPLFQYSAKYQGDLVISDAAYRSSDHDPIIVALSYPIPVPPTPEAKPVPAPDDGGSLGFLGLAFLSAFGLRRRRS